MGLGGIVPTRRIQETGGPTVLDLAAIADNEVLTRSGATIVGAAGAPPAAHDLGGASHNADTLADLNTKVSDATLIDTADARLSDSRAPNGAAGGDLAGTYPNPTVASIAGVFAIVGDISATLAANQNNYNPAGLATASVIRIDLDVNVALTGIAGGADGRILILYNIDTVLTLTLNHEDAASTAANRIIGPGGINVAIAQRGNAILQYDATSSRWRVLSNT